MYKKYKRIKTVGNNRDYKQLWWGDWQCFWFCILFFGI